MAYAASAFILFAVFHKKIVYDCCFSAVVFSSDKKLSRYLQKIVEENFRNTHPSAYQIYYTLTSQSTLLESISVKVSVNNTAVISAEKRKPFALWYESLDSSTFLLIDQYGDILSSQNATNRILYEPFSEIKLSVYGKNAAFKIYNAKIIYDTISHISSHILYLHLIENRRWNVVCKNGTIIMLPQQNAKEALSMLQPYISSMMRMYSKIDIRLFPEKFFLTPIVHQK
ncbi:cell division protein FtsQ/DivIB [Candidatus Fokinia crypta]|uniref:cell division protein FtsQ/DivIB n=1 Tax=Candidatus Fokinia crypta TaxID=1920990 RepID=UPI002B25D8A9|nr:cell division protein FtsQ/DivIB [Candidatus Fokinia cryptica]